MVVCLIGVLGMTGWELRKMEGEIVGKKRMKHRKGKKSKQTADKV